MDRAESRPRERRSRRLSSGLRRYFGFLAALAAPLALLLAAGTAQAQSATTFVSNTGQTEIGGCFFIGTSSSSVWRSALRFTTGGNSTGYTLSEVVLKVAGQVHPGLRMSIYTTNSSGHPDSSLYVLSNPASLTVNALNTFTAASGATLAANTTYAIVLESTGAGNPQSCFRQTSSDAEDSGAASGWSIADSRLFGTTSWSSATSMGLLQIKGTVGGFTGTPGSPGAPAAPDARKRMLERTLASVASRTVSGALDTLGARMGDAVPAAGLNLGGLALAGRPAPFGGEYAGGSGAAGFDGHGPDDAWPSGGGHGRGMTPDRLLGSGAFSYTLGAAPGDKADGTTAGPDAPRWGIWGRGDFGTFAGRSSEGSGEGSSHDGETRTGWLGADARGARGSGRWVAGLAVSRGTSRTDYVLGGERGRIETDLTALWPYGRWTYPGGLELRGLLGAGRGEVRHTAGNGEEEKSDLSMWAASVGLSRPLPPLAGLDLAARGDASLAFMETANGGGAVDGLSAEVARVRGGVEASRRIAMAEGGSLTPFAELAARMDGGDGIAGPGIEVAGGLRYAGPRVAVEVRGRWLAAHTEAGAEERGVSLTARLDTAAHGRGLSMSLAPRWGAGTDGAEALWRDEMPRGAAGADPAGGFEGEIGYGLGLDGGRFTGTPNVGFGYSDTARDYRIGWRLTPAARGHPGFEVSLDATRRESANANEPPAHGAMLTGAIRW